MCGNADVAWKALLNQGKFKVTEKGEVINLITQKELRKMPLKNPNNNSIAFTYIGKEYSLRKPRIIWLAFNDIPSVGMNVVSKDGSFDWSISNLELISNSIKHKRIIQKRREKSVDGKIIRGKNKKPIKEKSLKTSRAEKKINKLPIIAIHLNNEEVIKLRNYAREYKKIRKEWCITYNVSQKTLLEAVTGVTYSWLNSKNKPVKIQELNLEGA